MREHTLRTLPSSDFSNIALFKIRFSAVMIIRKAIIYPPLLDGFRFNSYLNFDSGI